MRGLSNEVFNQLSLLSDLPVEVMERERDIEPDAAIRAFMDRLIMYRRWRATGHYDIANDRMVYPTPCPETTMRA